MPGVTINGRACEVAGGATILTACRQLGIRVPTLCHDDRLTPAGACRLCLVEVGGVERPVPACSTPLADGMIVETHSPSLEDSRRTLLQWLAAGYPTEAVERFPEKEFHRLLKEYEVSPGAGLQGSRPVAAGINRSTPEPPSDFEPRLSDFSHPFLAVDLSKCVTCFRCVRICDEVQGQSIWRVLGRGDATRIVPDGGTLLASACVSCGACADTCPTGAIEDQSVVRWGPPSTWTRTTCPYCGVGCQLLVGSREGRLIQIKPDLEAAVNRGHLCAKGRYAFEFVGAADRVTSPMIREARGGWKTVSWPEAIHFVADRLRRMIAVHGPDSVGVLASARGTNEENYLAQKFARVVLGTNNVDGCARVCHQPTATGMARILGTGAATNSFADIETARSFLIVGCNPTENHPVVGTRIKQAVRNGARLVVIDPRRTELAEIADVHLALDPGTNIPLFNAMAGVILAERREDAAFLDARVTEVAAFREFIREWMPERAAGLCGVDAEAIRTAARLYAGAKPAMCFHGLGITEHTQGTETVMALVNLALLTGNLGIAGGGINPLRGQNNVQGSAHMGCEPGHLTGYASLEAGRELFGRSWQQPLPTRKGLNLLEMMDAAAAGALKALWAIGYDVAQTNPNVQATRRALQSLDLLIVQDLFLNETARELATVFLPACSSFEKDGTFMNGERRVQRVREAVSPAGHSRPDWSIICEIARAMGHGGQFDFHSAKAVWDEIRSVWPAGAGITYERLERSGLQWPCPSEDHPGTAILHSQSFAGDRPATLQRIDYRPTTERTSKEFPLLLMTGRTLHQFNAGTMTRRTPAAKLHPADYLELSREDAAELSLKDGDLVVVRSRYGAATLPVRVSRALRPGRLFTTFHFPASGVNSLTSLQRDRDESTPEYKVTAVGIRKAATSRTVADRRPSS